MVGLLGVLGQLALASEIPSCDELRIRPIARILIPSRLGLKACCLRAGSLPCYKRLRSVGRRGNGSVEHHEWCFRECSEVEHSEDIASLILQILEIASFTSTMKLR